MTRLGDVQRSETRRETRTSLLTALLWFASAVIVFAMLLRMLPNSLVCDHPDYLALGVCRSDQ